MSSLPTVPDLDSLFELAWDFRFTRSMWIISYVLLIYDHMITFSDEVLYMWKAKWTRAKVLFLLTRYWTTISLLPSIIVISLDRNTVMVRKETMPPLEPLADSTTSDVSIALLWAGNALEEDIHPSYYYHRCKFSYGWFVYSELITQTLGSTILILRVYAIYDCNKILLRCLSGFLGAVLLIQTIFSAILSKETGTALNKTIHASGCIPNTWLYKPWVYWVPATTFDGLLFLLVIAKSIRCSRERDTTPHLLFTMLRDSSLYFGFVFMVIIADLIVWTRAGEGLYVALPELVPVLHSVMACRMLLNIVQETRPWLAEPWKDQDAAVFSAAVKLMSFFRSRQISSDLESPTSQPQPPMSPVSEEL
ncbi:hypothetical protein BDY19DRAFT_997172 [Irpex rosettiformis]|uniref:Uncharacterized protein n=1 Tax=Irpex rosettiformis TaxID=378272 RepID=A0ACB8TSQ4_9APHY|nr:hypothetical protein BDY19DRAFT_997172 [Irpex rosettiformis]